MRLYLPLTHLYQGVDLDPLPSSFPCAATMASGTISATWPLPEICSQAIKTSSAGNEPRSELCAKEPSLAIMGLLTVIKKVKAKEKEIRLLMV